MTVPSRKESANHRFLSPHACDRRRRGQGEPFGAFQCGYQPGAAECCPPLGLPFPRRPTIVSRCCGRCSHGRARPNMAMRKRTRRILASRFDLGVKCGDGACEPFLKSGDKQWEETRPVTPGSPSLSPSCCRGSRTPAFRAALRGWLGDRVGRDMQGVTRSRQPAAISLSRHIPVPQCR